MQISRHLLITCAVAACLTPTFIHAYDNEAQIRARQALDEQMKQMATQAPPATSAPPAAVSKPKSKPPVKVKEVKPAAPAPVAPAAPVMSAPATSNAADDQLTEALRQKMNETAPEPVKPPVVVKKTEPKPNKVKVVKVKPAPVQPQPAMVIETTKPATVENPPAQAAPAFAPEISQPATPAPAAPVVTAQAMPMPETTNPADARLTDALHQKMHEETEPIVTPVPPPQKVVKPKNVKPAPPIVVKTAPAQPETHVVVTPVPPPAAVPAHAPMTAPASTYAPIPETSHTVTSLPATPTPAPAPGNVMTQMPPPAPAPAPLVKSTPAAAATMSLPALSGPPSPLSATKQQKLDALLQQYRMDQLTPQQYHEERAKVLAEP